MVLVILSSCREELAPLQKGEYTCKYQSSYMWQWRALYWASLQSLVESYWVCTPRDGEAGKDTLSHAHFIPFIRGLPSTAVPAAVQFITLLESWNLLAPAL